MDVNCFVLRYFLVVDVRIGDRTILHACGTAPTLILADVAWPLEEGNREIPRLAFNAEDIRIGEDLDICLPADLDQFRRKYSHGTVVGGKGLVQLRHVAADGRHFLHEKDRKTRVGQVQRRLDTADTAADDHHVTEITVADMFLYLFYIHC